MGIRGAMGGDLVESDSLEETRFFEELALNMWPSLQTVHYDGWVLRFANSLSRRANCIVPMRRSTEPLEDKIDYCRELFERVGIVPAFKIFPAPDSEALEQLLEARGYDACFETRVLARDLDRLGAGRAGGAAEGELRALSTEEWCREYIRLSGKRDAATLHGIVSNVRAEHLLGALELDGEVAAVGMAVLQRGHVGLQGVVVDKSLRGRGLGARVTGALLRWGGEMGAHRAYLQVDSDNEPANRLYDRLGFRAQYRYWYRCTEVPRR